MKVLRTIETFYPYVCGPANLAFRVSQGLYERGISSPVLTTYCDVNGNLPSVEKIQDVEVHRYQYQARMMRYCVSLGMAEAFRDYDILHSHNYRNFQSDMAFVFSRFHKKPFVLSAHGSLLGFQQYLSHWKSRLPYRLYDYLTLKTTAKRAQKVIVSTTLEYEDAIEFGIEKRKLEIISEGVDPVFFSQSRSYVDSGPLRLLFVGRIARNRNVELIIRALTRLDGVVLDIVGGEERTSSTSRAGYVAELMNLAKELKVAERVNFAGPQYGEELRRFYLNSDIFIYPSTYENFGQPILEAATTGLPIISTPVGVARDIVIPGETGFWVKMDPGEIAARVEDLRPVRTREEFGVRIRALAGKNYQWEEIIKRYVKVYEDLL